MSTIIFDAALGGAQIELAGPGGYPGLIIDELRRPEIVQAEIAWTMGGKMIRWEKARNAVPLTLTGGDSWGWISVGDLAALEALASAPNPATPYVLAYMGTNYNVVWRFEDTPVIEAELVMPAPDELPGWYQNVRLKFMRILS